jgi:hypothetical protein
MEPGLPELERFEEYAQDAFDSLPPDLRARISNVEIVIEDEPPTGQPLLGLYQGVPLTRRGSSYGAVLPDKITIFRGPLVRLLDTPRRRLAAKSDGLCSTKSPTTSVSATNAWSSLTVTDAVGRERRNRKKAPAQGLFSMELAGLEPATSWVR